MKKRWIVIAVIVVILMIFANRYAVIEQDDILPERLRSALMRFGSVAAAETVQPSDSGEAVPDAAQGNKEAPQEMAVPPRVQPTDRVIVQVQQPAPSPTPIPTPTPVLTPTPIPTPEPVLESGDRGDEVKKLQQRLQELGFLTGKADGIYGAKTEQAVKDFRQHMYDLEQERIAAERARLEEEQRKLEEEQKRLEEEQAQQNEEAVQTSPQPQIDQTAAPETTPQTEDSGKIETEDKEIDGEAADTTVIDTEETELTESADDLEEGEAADAQSGDTQEEAVVIEGKVDQETYRLLLEGGFDEYQQKLLSGTQGAEVKRLQLRLKALGYLNGAADGIFGQKTLAAVKSFQLRNKLTQDGIAGEKTQRKLYSSTAVRYVADPTITAEQRKYTGKPYFLKVSTQNQRVYAYAWSEADGAYSRLVRTMICSTGLADTPTPKGTYSSETKPRVKWGYFPKYDVWAQYLYRISGPYLFHSVLYEEADESTVKWGSVNKLGSPASHGCVRLQVEDAKWIYENCPAGTTVQVV